MKTNIRQNTLCYSALRAVIYICRPLTVKRQILFWRKREKWIQVLPKNYRNIVLYTIKNLEEPEVLLDGKKVFDFSDQGPLTQVGLSKCRNFEIRNGKKEVLGFHDHPREM